MSWNTIASFILEEVKERLAQPQTRKDALGGFKRTQYRLNDTGSLSDSLAMEVLQFGSDVQLALTYPNVGENDIKAKIYFETGRRPNVGVNIENLRGWADRKLPGFAGLTPEEKTFRLIRISMKIKQRGIGTYPVFDPSFIEDVRNKYQQWFIGLSDEEVEQLPGLQEVFNALGNIKIFDQETIEIFR